MFKMAMMGYCLGVNRLVYLVGFSASVLMPLLALTVAFEVFSRYVLGSPTIWAYDVSLFLFGYIAALGGALAQQKKAHINVDVFYLSVSARFKSLFNLLSYSLAIFFLVVVLMMCYGKFEEAVEFNYRRQSEWAPTMAHFWIMMIVACGTFILQYTSDLLQDIYFLLTERQLLAQQEEICDDNNKTSYTPAGMEDV
ncbi:TRAP transporter small permease [Photobacterium sp. SDRW27]|uniref:TRAP transporter small permease subunit n=1 Tax=Photobacterium obscurum TaxID=2829490 RepID=UPI002244C899|nr:TRAP transporter small permease [Photobacterium obscurum]MCW8328939.1 TRAP transporter small permease [Photobacterium obscurum]